MQVDQARDDPLEIPRGVDWAIAWPVIDLDGQPIADLSGYAAFAQVRPRASSETVLATFASASVPGDATGITLQDGHVVLAVTSQQSTSWEWEVGVYDVLMLTPESQTYLVAAGGVRLLRTVSRWPS